MQILRIITIVILLASVPSCKETGVGPSESRNPPIPFAVGNRWTYVDSFYTKTGLTVNTLTVTIVSSRKDSVGVWWRFNRSFNPSIVAVEFMCSGDSIFSLQYADAMSGLVPIRSLEYVCPLGRESTCYNATFDGDVNIDKSISYSRKPFSIAAGMFASSLVVRYEIGGEVYRETVAPNVGMVDLEVINNSPISLYQWWTRRRIQLLEYHVSQ
jgi:hypothetical protein